MAKNKLSDLNNHLFAQIERLSDEELTDEQLEKEVKRSKAMIGVSAQIIKGNKLVIEAMKLVASGDFEKNEVPETIAVLHIKNNSEK